MHDIQPPPAPPAMSEAEGQKFTDPDLTAKGEPRASVALDELQTLWFNTGTLCNIECRNCYIESSPKNDRLVYLTRDEVARFLDEIAALGLTTREIGFTGGEPFMNPAFPAMLADALARGFHVLVLTNAMKPLMRPKVQAALKALTETDRERLTFRVSLDHYTAKLHDEERGAGSFDKALAGMRWLQDMGFRLHIGGRTCWGEDPDKERAGYQALIEREGLAINGNDPGALVLFPEMDESADVPEITTACWGLLGKSPSDMMCASSRMVVRRKGDATPQILPCTLIAYRKDFQMGSTLAEMLPADGGMFADGAVKLCHPHCAKFCVLGGGSCSV